MASRWLPEPVRFSWQQHYCSCQSRLEDVFLFSTEQRYSTRYNMSSDQPLSTRSSFRQSCNQQWTMERTSLKTHCNFHNSPPEAIITSHLHSPQSDNLWHQTNWQMRNMNLTALCNFRWWFIWSKLSHNYIVAIFCIQTYFLVVKILSW